MTTYIVLALLDDGSVADAYEYDRSELLNFREKMPLPTSASGSDCVTYEIAEYVVNVCRR